MKPKSQAYNHILHGLVNLASSDSPVKLISNLVGLLQLLTHSIYRQKLQNLCESRDFINLYSTKPLILKHTLQDVNTGGTSPTPSISSSRNNRSLLDDDIGSTFEIVRTSNSVSERQMTQKPLISVLSNESKPAARAILIEEIDDDPEQSFYPSVTELQPDELTIEACEERISVFQPFFSATIIHIIRFSFARWPELALCPVALSILGLFFDIPREHRGLEEFSVLTTLLQLPIISSQSNVNMSESQLAMLGAKELQEIISGLSPLDVSPLLLSLLEHLHNKQCAFPEQSPLFRSLLVGSFKESVSSSGASVPSKKTSTSNGTTSNGVPFFQGVYLFMVLYLWEQTIFFNNRIYEILLDKTYLDPKSATKSVPRQFSNFSKLSPMITIPLEGIIEKVFLLSGQIDQFMRLFFTKFSLPGQQYPKSMPTPTAQDVLLQLQQTLAESKHTKTLHDITLNSDWIVPFQAKAKQEMYFVPTDGMETVLRSAAFPSDQSQNVFAFKSTTMDTSFSSCNFSAVPLRDIPIALVILRSAIDLFSAPLSPMYTFPSKLSVVTQVVSKAMTHGCTKLVSSLFLSTFLSLTIVYSDSLEPTSRPASIPMKSEPKDPSQIAPEISELLSRSQTGLPPFMSSRGSKQKMGECLTVAEPLNNRNASGLLAALRRVIYELPPEKANRFLDNITVQLLTLRYGTNIVAVHPYLESFLQNMFPSDSDSDSSMQRGFSGMFVSTPTSGITSETPFPVFRLPFEVSVQHKIPFGDLHDSPFGLETTESSKKFSLFSPISLSVWIRACNDLLAFLYLPAFLSSDFHNVYRILNLDAGNKIIESELSQYLNRSDSFSDDIISKTANHIAKDVGEDFSNFALSPLKCNLPENEKNNQLLREATQSFISPRVQFQCASISYHFVTQNFFGRVLSKDEITAFLHVIWVASELMYPSLRYFPDKQSTPQDMHMLPLDSFSDALLSRTAEIWSSPSTIRTQSLQSQETLSQIILELLDLCSLRSRYQAMICSSNPAFSLSSTNDLGFGLHRCVRFIMNGVQSRLSSPVQQTRRMGMQVARAFSWLLDPTNPLDFGSAFENAREKAIFPNNASSTEFQESFFYSSIDTSPLLLMSSIASDVLAPPVRWKDILVQKIDHEWCKVEQVSCEPTWDIPAPGSKSLEKDDYTIRSDVKEESTNSNSSQSQSQSQSQFPTPASTNEKSRMFVTPRDGLEALSLLDNESDLLKVPRPRYLHECVLGLRHEDRSMVLAALSYTEKLIKTSSVTVDFTEVCLDLLGALINLYSTDHIRSPAAIRARGRSIVALILALPAPILAFLASQLHSHSRTISDRADILDIIIAASVEMAALSPMSMYGNAPSPGIITLHTILGANGYLDANLSILFSQFNDQATKRLAQPKKPTVRHTDKRAQIRATNTFSEAVAQINTSVLSQQEREMLDHWKIDAKTIRRTDHSEARENNRVNHFAPLVWNAFFCPLLSRVDVTYVNKLVSEGRPRKSKSLLHPDDDGFVPESMFDMKMQKPYPTSGLESDPDLNHVTLLSRDPLLLSKLVHTVSIFVECAGPFAPDLFKLIKGVMDLCFVVRVHPQPSVRRSVLIAYQTIVSVLSSKQLLEMEIQEAIFGVIAFIKERLMGEERELDEVAIVLAKEVLQTIVLKTKRDEPFESNSLTITKRQ